MTPEATKALREAVEVVTDKDFELTQFAMRKAHDCLSAYGDELLALVEGQGWIAVSERLPDSDREVDITYEPAAHGRGRKSRRVVTVARYSGGAWRFTRTSYAGNKATMKSERVIAWKDRPLPAPPQEET